MVNDAAQPLNSQDLGRPRPKEEVISRPRPNEILSRLELMSRPRPKDCGPNEEGWRADSLGRTRSSGNLRPKNAVQREESLGRERPNSKVAKEECERLNSYASISRERPNVHRTFSLGRSSDRSLPSYDLGCRSGLRPRIGH